MDKDDENAIAEKLLYKSKLHSSDEKDKLQNQHTPQPGDPPLSNYSEVKYLNSHVNSNNNTIQSVEINSSSLKHSREEQRLYESALRQENKQQQQSYPSSLTNYFRDTHQQNKYDNHSKQKFTPTTEIKILRTKTDESYKWNFNSHDHRLHPEERISNQPSSQGNNQLLNMSVDGFQSRNFQRRNNLKKTSATKRKQSNNIEDDMVDNIYKFESQEHAEEQFLNKLYQNSKIIKKQQENNSFAQSGNRLSNNNKYQQHQKKGYDFDMDEQPNQLAEYSQYEESTQSNDQDEQKQQKEGEEDNDSQGEGETEEISLIDESYQHRRVGLNKLMSCKQEIKMQFNKFHHSVEITQIRKKYRKKLFYSLVYATFFQFFVDNLITQIEQVIGSVIYSSQDGLYNYQVLNTNVTLYFAIFNVAFFPLLMGFVIDQFYCHIVMKTSILLMFFGRVISLLSIIYEIYQMRILGQFFYSFGDSGFYLTSIYCIYFFFFNPEEPKNFVKKLTKYLGIGCSLPRNLSAIPMIFVYTASQKIQSYASETQNIKQLYEQYMPLLFSSPYKEMIFSAITSLVLFTVFFAYRAQKIDQQAQSEISAKNFNYTDNPLFKANVSDVKRNFSNIRYIGVIVAGGIIYGLTSSNVIYNINKLVYNEINNTKNNPPDLTLFVIISGHELVYIMFIWSFGKKISKNFQQKYGIWKMSVISCSIYFLIQLVITAIVKAQIGPVNQYVQYIIYIFMFILNIFSGISFSTNVLCVDSILAKMVEKSCIALGYAFMILFKKFFELFGDLAVDYDFQNVWLPIIAFVSCLIALIFVFWISKIQESQLRKEQLNQANYNQLVAPQQVQNQ